MTHDLNPSFISKKRGTTVKIVNKGKVRFILLLMILCMAYLMPATVAYAKPPDTKVSAATEEESISEEASEEETTTIEEEPTAEAASPQSQMALMTQMTIIGIGILMVGVGTYVFIFKAKTEE